MTNVNQTDVLVAGAGPVGMLTALLLTQNGIKTQIIDQESRPAGHSCSCALHPFSLRLLSQAGVAANAIKLGRRVDIIAFYEGNRRRAEVSLSELPGEFPFVLVLEQSALENLLEQKLLKEGIPIQWSHRLAGLEMDNKGVTADIEKLGMIGKGYAVPDFGPGVEKTLQTRGKFVVGADGADSMVRARLGIVCEDAGPARNFAIYEIETGGGCGHEAQVVLDDATAVLWPLSDTRCRWTFQIEASQEKQGLEPKQRDRVIVTEASDQPELNSLLRVRAPWFQQKCKEMVWTANVQFQPRLARQFGRDFCWLAGDAAHESGPVGTQSLNMGCREAAVLADGVTQILRQGTSVELLRDYERAFRGEWQELLGFRQGIHVSAGADDWVRQKAFRIVGSVPASGSDLTFLLRQLGIDFQPDSMPEMAHF